MATPESRLTWADPRPDLYADSSLWTRLLRAAYGQDGGDPRGLFAALHGFRCCGASLRLGQKSAVLGPGEIPEATYVGWRRRWLEPHKEELIRLLAAVAAERLAA